MSFGFSASDFVGLARIVFQLYIELKGAPGKVSAFAEDLRSFERILEEVERFVKEKVQFPEDTTCSELKTCLSDCRHLILSEICGVADTQDNFEQLHNQDYRHICRNIPRHGNHRLFRTTRMKLAERWREKDFVRKIPEFQCHIASHIRRLTALGVVEMRYNVYLHHDVT